MTMTYKLANTLMETLCCLAISGMITNKDAVITDARDLPENMLELAEKFAQTTFQEICGEWEEIFDEEWKIEDPEVDEIEYEED